MAILLRSGQQHSVTQWSPNLFIVADSLKTAAQERGRRRLKSQSKLGGVHASTSVLSKDVYSGGVRGLIHAFFFIRNRFIRNLHVEGRNI